MSILVGRIENKFWSNSDYKFPNGFPVYEEQEDLKDVEPNMNNFMTGTVYLFGDKWNHCVYNGAYYSLYILQVIDEQRKFYSYRLERDFWFDVLKLRPTVVGDLITSNNDELLEKNLNRTVSVIDNPARVVTINFGEVAFDWRKNFEFKPATQDIPQVVLSLTDFNRFVDSMDSVFINSWRDEIDKALYSKNKNPAVFIVDVLEGSTIVTGWKNTLRKKINEFIEGIPRTTKTDLKLAKVELSGANAASPLVGKYCITQTIDGLSTTSEGESYQVTRIDLSGLTDIVPLNIHDLQEVTPNVNLLTGDKSGLFPYVDVQESRNFFAKVKRKAYVPISASPEKRPQEVGFGFEGNWRNAKDPQKIVWRYAGEEKEEYLWWVDNLNFAIQRTGFKLETEMPANQSIEASREVESLWPTKISPFPSPWTAGKIFPQLNVDQYVPLGFVIYKINRTPDAWNLFEYKAKRKLTRIQYINGIKDEFIKHYRKSGEWWSKLPEELNKTNKSSEFLRFYLDTYRFSMMAILPGTYYPYPTRGLSRNYASYYNTDLWGLYKMTNYKYYVPEVAWSDVFDIDGNWREKTFFSKDRYGDYVRRIDDHLRRFLNFDFFDLPENMEIDEGDYFFSDVDYEIERRFIDDVGKQRGKDWAEFARRETNTGLSRYRGETAVWEFVDQMRLEDFVKLPSGTSVLDCCTGPIGNGKSIFGLCTTLKGNVDIRHIKSFRHTLNLSTASDEIVQSVDSGTARNTTFILMKKFSDPLIPERGKFEITEELKAKLIKGFYKAKGYNVIGESPVFWTWFNESDFSERSQEQLLFDLKGTDWYCFIAKGKISLICKNEKLIKAAEKNFQSLLYGENTDFNPSLIEKINQRTRLQFFTAPYYLNFKTTFSEADRISLYFQSLTPTGQQTQFEQYFLRLDTGFDRIWYENISIPKEVTRGLSVGDSVALQRLHMDLIRDQYTYQIDQDRLALTTKRYEEAIKRSQIELNNQRLQSYINLGVSLATGGLGLGIAAKVQKGNKTVSIRERRGVKSVSSTLFNLNPENNEVTSTGRTARFAVPTYEKNVNIRYAASRMPTLIGRAASSAISTAANFIYDHAVRFPEMERRIGVEKQLGAEELGLTSLGINTAHMDRQVTAQQQINQISNMYNNPFINERFILEEYNKKKEWHGKELKNIYLMVFIPSEEQLIALRSFKEEFGVMCDIPDIRMQFYEGMEPDIIRYRNLDDEAIKGIDNLWIRGFLKSHLMAGIKVIGSVPTPVHELTREEYRQKVITLTREISTKEDKVKQLQEDLETTRKTCDQEKDEIQKRIKQLENDLANVNAKLATKTGEITTKVGECEEAKKKLDEELKKHKIDKEIAEQALNDREREILNLKDERNRLSKEKQDLTTSLEEYEEDKKRLAWNRKELANKRKELEAANKQKENLENQKSDIERQLREALAAKEQLQKSKDDLQATFDTCKKNRQEQKVKLEAKIDELQRQLDSSSANLPVDCSLLLKYLTTPYEVDLKVKDDGSNALRQLIIEVIEEITWMRNGQFDQKLSLKYPVMRPVFNTLMKFLEIPLVAKWEEAISNPGWHGYKQYLKDNRTTNVDVQKVISIVREITGGAGGAFSMENVPAAHGIKAILDELNWLTYKAKEQLKEPLKTDQDLQYMFAHIYPGTSLVRYEELFGDPDIYITKRLFMEQVDCENTNVSAILKLRDLDNTTTHSIEDIAKQQDRKFVPIYRNAALVINPQKIRSVYGSRYPNIEPKAMRSSAVSELTLIGTKERVSNKNFVLTEMRITPIQPAEALRRRVYWRVTERDLWKKVMDERNKLWANRKNIVKPANWPDSYLTKRKLNWAGMDNSNVSGSASDSGVFRKSGYVDSFYFSKVFGNYYAFDALYLHTILCYTGIETKVYRQDTYEYQELSLLKSFSSVDDPKLQSLLFMRKDAPESEYSVRGPGFDLTDTSSYLNYIWRQITLDKQTLEDPNGSLFSDTNRLDLNKVLNEIYDSTQ